MIDEPAGLADSSIENSPREELLYSVSFAPSHLCSALFLFFADHVFL